AACPLATSHRVRAAIVSVLPEPAPAITRAGWAGSALMTATCSGVGGGSSRAAAISSALRARGRGAGAGAASMRVVSVTGDLPGEVHEADLGARHGEGVVNGGGGELGARHGRRGV